VESAANGTLFLDEVGDLSIEAQAKLLRFLEKGEFYRVGGTSKRQIRTRVISATNKDLRQMMEEGRFRRDLYYRLAVVKLEVPSLNQRRDDIVPIARNFLVQFSRGFGKSFTGISPQAERALEEFHWKGNVRELRNIIEKAVLIADGPGLILQDLGLEESYKDELLKEVESRAELPSISQSSIDFPFILKSIERHYIEEALTMAKGNESKAAHLLQLSRDTLRYRRNKLQIPSHPPNSN